MSSVLPKLLGEPEFQSALNEINPKPGLGNLLGIALKYMNRRAGWFRMNFFEKIQTKFHPSRNLFLARSCANIPFVGDFRDLDTWYWMAQPGHGDDIVKTIVEQLLKRDGVYIDVGTNVGMIISRVAKKLPNTQVIGIEPMEPTAKRAAATFALNGVRNCTLVNAAVGESNGVLEIKYNPNFTGQTSVHKVEFAEDDHVSTLTVPIFTLDDLIQTMAPGKISLIKIDVEGHEFAVLSGAQNALREHEAAILFEYNPPIARAAGWTPKQAVDLLRSLRNYDISVLDPVQGKHPYSDDLDFGDGIVDLLCEPVTALTQWLP